jgi:predicted nucleic acid-binding protein
MIKADPLTSNAAVEGNATHLVSGDRDLLRLGRFEGIAIVTPQAFLDALAAP